MIRALVATLLLTLSGCAVLKGKDQVVTLRLRPSVPTVAGPVSPETVALATVRARGLTGQTRFAFITENEPGALQQARTLFWEEPPAQTLEHALATALRGRFAVVARRGMAVRADRRLTVTLTRFEEISGSRARAVVGFEAVMLGGGKIVRAGEWCASVPVAAGRPTARAQAFEAALVAAVGRFVQAADGDVAVAETC